MTPNQNECFFVSKRCGLLWICATRINKFYNEVLKWLRNRVRHVRREICNNWMLRYDNAPSHTTLIISELKSKNNGTTLVKPPYSPDLASTNFPLLPGIKRTFKGIRHGTLKAVKVATIALKRTSVIDIKGAFYDWMKHWQWCIGSWRKGPYFKKFWTRQIILDETA